MELHLVRHTTPLIEKGVCYGQSDIPLADSYEEEKKLIQTRLDDSYDEIHSSPFSRCLMLAKDLAQQGHVKTDPRLIEYNFGDWEMMPWDDIDQTNLNKWMKDFVNVNAPNGENVHDLYARTISWLEEIQDADTEKALVVTHAGVIRCCWAYVLEIPLKNIFRLDVDYGSVVKIQLGKEKAFHTISM